MFTDNSHYLENQGEDIKFLAVSNVRTKILLSLYDGPKKLAYLRDKTGIASSTIIHGLGQLENRKWIVRRGDNSYITSKGKIILLNLIKIMQKLETIKKQQIFWKNHNLNGIPLKLQKNIHLLSESYLVEVKLDNLEEPFTKYLELLSNAKNICAVLPVCFSRHTDAIQRILVNGGFVKLILDKNILKQFIEQFNTFDMIKFVKRGSLEILVVQDNLEVACVVSENFASLGLFFENGVYDTSCLLMGHNISALDWGKSLFQHYKNLGENIDKTAIKQMNHGLKSK